MCFYRNLTWRGDFITGDPGRYVEKGLELGIPFYRNSVGEPNKELIYQELWEMDERGSSGSASLSEGALWGEPGRRVLYWGHWRMCIGRLWRQASLSIGAPLGNLEGGSYTGDAERWMTEDSNGASLSEGALWGEPGGRAPLLVNQKDTLGLWKWTSVSIGAPLLENMEGRSFPRLFERRDKFIYLFIHLGEFL